MTVSPTAKVRRGWEVRRLRIYPQQVIGSPSVISWTSAPSPPARTQPSLFIQLAHA